MLPVGFRICGLAKEWPFDLKAIVPVCVNGQPEVEMRHVVCQRPKTVQRLPSHLFKCMVYPVHGNRNALQKVPLALGLGSYK